MNSPLYWSYSRPSTSDGCIVWPSFPPSLASLHAHNHSERRKLHDLLQSYAYLWLSLDISIKCLTWRID